MRGQPGLNTQPHVRLQPSFQDITSEVNEALVCKLRVSLMVLSDIFDIPSMGVLYNQALSDVRSTGAGIKCLYCTITTTTTTTSTSINTFVCFSCSCTIANFQCK